MWQKPPDRTRESSSPLNIKDVGRERKKQREETESEEKHTATAAMVVVAAVDLGFLSDS